MTIPRWLLLAAILLALAVARRERAHLPLALALGVALAGDLARAHLDLGARVELAIILATPACAAWAAMRVLAREPPLRALGWALLAGVPPWITAVALPLFWRHAHLEAHVVALIVQAGAGIVFWISARPRRTPEICALLLAGGDVLALAGPLALGGPWAIAAGQAGVIAGVLVLVQGFALWRVGGRDEIHQDNRDHRKA